MGGNEREKMYCLGKNVELCTRNIIISGINAYGVRVSLPVLASASRGCSARLIRIAVVDAASIIHRFVTWNVLSSSQRKGHE